MDTKIMHKSSHHGHEVRVEPFGPPGGYVVYYRDATPGRLNELRLYQKQVREQAPGWMTLFGFDRSSREARLQVFPTWYAPLVLFRPGSRYDT
jgi:hypothetical protein